MGMISLSIRDLKTICGNAARQQVKYITKHMAIWTVDLSRAAPGGGQLHANAGSQPARGEVAIDEIYCLGRVKASGLLRPAPAVNRLEVDFFGLYTLADILDNFPLTVESVKGDRRANVQGYTRLPNNLRRPLNDRRDPF